MLFRKYKLRFFIEWGGCYLWPDTSDPYTFKKYDVGPIDPRTLGVSTALCDELDMLDDEYQSALDWEYPPNPSPWTAEHFEDFYTRLRSAYERLCQELKKHYKIEDCMKNHRW